MLGSSNRRATPRLEVEELNIQGVRNLGTTTLHTVDYLGAFFRSGRDLICLIKTLLTKVWLSLCFWQKVFCKKSPLFGTTTLSLGIDLYIERVYNPSTFNVKSAVCISGTEIIVKLFTKESSNFLFVGY